MAKRVLSISQQTIALRMVAQGRTILDIAPAIGLCVSEFHPAKRNTPTFQERFDAAQLDGYDILADRLLQVAEELDPARAKILSDNIKWLLSKRAAPRYGDRMDITVGPAVNIQQALIDAQARVVSGAVLTLVEDKRDSDAIETEEINSIEDIL